MRRHMHVYECLLCKQPMYLPMRCYNAVSVLPRSCCLATDFAEPEGVRHCLNTALRPCPSMCPQRVGCKRNGCPRQHIATLPEEKAMHPTYALSSVQCWVSQRAQAQQLQFT